MSKCHIVENYMSWLNVIKGLPCILNTLKVKRYNLTRGPEGPEALT